MQTQVRKAERKWEREKDSVSLFRSLAVFCIWILAVCVCVIYLFLSFLSLPHTYTYKSVQYEAKLMASTLLETKDPFFLLLLQAKDLHWERHEFTRRNWTIYPLYEEGNKREERRNKPLQRNEPEGKRKNSFFPSPHMLQVLISIAR